MVVRLTAAVGALGVGGVLVLQRGPATGSLSHDANPRRSLQAMAHALSRLRIFAFCANTTGAGGGARDVEAFALGPVRPPCPE